MEPSKLKVAELRAELQARGLDSKGVKAVLVDRLEKALIQEAEQAEAEDVEEIEDDDEIEQAQEALPEAEQGFGEEFGFTEDSADAGDMQEDDLLQGDDGGEEAGGDDDQLLADLDIPQAMEEPEAEPEPVAEAEAEAEPETAEPVAEPEAEPMEEQAQQPAEEAQEAPQEKQVPEAAAESSDAKPEGVEQEEAPKTEDQENKEPSAEDDKKDDDKSKERKRDYENRNRDRRFGGRDRSPRRRTPPPVVMEEDDDIPDTQCVLSKYLSDLNLKIGKDGYSASPLSMEGFAYMWGGVKSTHGVSKGRIGYECKLESQADVRHLPPEETNRHVVRVGWSTDPTSLQLGEEAFSYGYGGTGKASVNCAFRDFGEKFGVNDVIGSYVDFEGEKPTISYTKNGTDLGVAFTIEDDLNGQALFPHIMVKNISVEVNFGQREEPWFPLKEGFSFIGKLPEEDTVRGPKPPATKKECEDVVALLVGFVGEWNPAIVPMRHVLEGKAVQQTFVTVMRMGVLLRGRVVSVLGKAQEVDELGKYLPQVQSVEEGTKVEENDLMSCEGIVTKSMQSLLETRLVSLYRTSVDVSAAFPQMTKSRPLIDAQCEEAKRGFLDDADQKREGREQKCLDASSKVEQKGGVLEGILTTFSSLNQTLGSIDSKLSNLSEVTQTLGSIDSKLTMALQAVEKRADDAQGKRNATSPSDGNQGRKASSARRDSTGKRGSIGRRSSLSSFLSKKSPKKSTKSKSPRSSFIPLEDHKVKKPSFIGKCTVAGQRKSDITSQTKSLTHHAVGQTKSSAINAVGQNKSVQSAYGRTRLSAQGVVGPRKSLTPVPLCETKLPSHGVGIRRKSLALPTPSKPYLTTAEADKIFRSSANYRICALRLARKLLPGKSKVAGMPEPGKDALGFQKETVARSKEIKKLIFEMYNIPATDQASVWKECSQLIAHSSIDEDKQSSPFPRCPKLVGSRGRIQ